MDDRDVLRTAAADGRTLVSHDKRTMPRSFAMVLAEGIDIPGVFLVIPQSAEIQRVVECLVLVWAASEPEEWSNRITRIPFL